MTDTDRRGRHEAAFRRWQDAERAYWDMLEQLRSGVTIAESNQRDVLGALRDRHAAWMSAADELLFEADAVGAGRGISAA